MEEKMNYQKISGKGYDIHVINNKKFHTVDCRIYFTENVTKELVTYRNALISVLTYATNNYDTKEKLIKKCQDLYSLVPVSSSNRNGNLMTTKFSLSTVNSSYIKENNLIDNILLLREIILNPLVENNGFKKKYFDIIKRELETETKTISEEPRLYANIELIKLIGENKIFSGYSDLDILNKMDEKKLYQSYLDMINNSKIDIFISGNIKNTKEVVKVIKDNFVFNVSNFKLNNLIVLPDKKNIKPIIKEEVKNYQQSKLSMGYRFFDLTDFEGRYVLPLFNTILGNGPNSLLMRKIREENSLCYYVNSYCNRLDNIALVNSGIDKVNIDKVIEMVNQVINNIIDGKFTNKDLEEAKMDLLMGLATIWDSNKSIIEYYYGINIFNSHDIKKKIEMVKKVSKEDIISVAKKLNLEGIFFLKGDL
jgi:predicted Zn-dependent peptidase